jgi:hypothetical protein
VIFQNLANWTWSESAPALTANIVDGDYSTPWLSGENKPGVGVIGQAIYYWDLGSIYEGFIKIVGGIEISPTTNDVFAAISPVYAYNSISQNLSSGSAINNVGNFPQIISNSASILESNPKPNSIIIPFIGRYVGFILDSDPDDGGNPSVKVNIYEFAVFGNEF